MGSKLEIPLLLWDPNWKYHNYYDYYYGIQIENTIITMGSKLEILL